MTRSVTFKVGITRELDLCKAAEAIKFVYKSHYTTNKCGGKDEFWKALSSVMTAGQKKYYLTEKDFFESVKDP